MFFFSCLLTEHWYWFAPERDLHEWYAENFPDAAGPIPERLAAELTAVAAWNRRREWRKTLAICIGEGRSTVDAIAEFEIQELDNDIPHLEELAHRVYARAANHQELQLHEFSMLPTASGESIATLESYQQDGELVFRYRSWSRADEHHVMNLNITTRDGQFLPNIIETGQIATESMVFEQERV